MDAGISNSEIEGLLAHSEWLSGLARRLVRDPAAAEDLVQDTWHVALRSGHGKERGWLATVISNLARARARGESARRERERRCAASEGIEGPDQLVLRAESQRNLLAHVLSLDEPYRTTLLARYVEGRSAAEIARRSGVNESTVRTRLARALEQLRARLSGEHRADRMLGLGALLAGAGGGAGGAVTTGGMISKAATAGIGVWIMGTTTKIAIAAAVLLCAWLAWRPTDQGPADLDRAGREQAPKSEAPIEAPTPEPSSTREALEKVAVQAPATSQESVDPSKPSVAPPTAKFEVLFTRDGAPVAGVTAWLIAAKNAGWSKRAKNPVMFIDLLDVRFAWPSDSPKATSNSDGIAAFSELPVVLYHLGFNPNSAERPTQIANGGTQEGMHTGGRVEVRLGSASVHGTVFDDQGRLRPGVGILVSVHQYG
ncbi:MAG: RNA polymerase sigma factor, partial [Planctomycetota bacterium]